MGAQDIFVSLYKEKGAQMGSKICSSWNWNYAQNGKFYFVSDIWIAHNQVIPWRTTVSVFFHFLIFPFLFWPLCRTYMWLGRQEVLLLSVGVLNSGISWQLHVLCKSGCKIPGQLAPSLYMLTWICWKIVHIENYMLLIIFEHMHITSASKEQSSYHLSSENVRKGYNVLSCKFLINIHGAVRMPLNMQDTGTVVSEVYCPFDSVSCLLPAVAVRVHDINP